MGKEAIARLHHKIKKLLQIICKHLDGLVLFIDDLQFSDTATIDLLQSILLDSDIASLLLVGAYRDDEVSWWVVKCSLYMQSQLLINTNQYHSVPIL